MTDYANLSIYKKDFIKKKLKKFALQKTTNQEFQNPITQQNTVLQSATFLKKQLKNSEYRNSFCDASEEEKNIQAKITISYDAYIPATTYLANYKNPHFFNTTALKTQLIKNVDNLTPNKERNKILKIRCGISEYMENIGELGDMRIKHNWKIAKK